MYALPDFDNVKAYNSSELSFRYPPPASSPFLTLGSGFFEKSFTKTSLSEQSSKQNSNSNRRLDFATKKVERRHFSRDQNKSRFSCDSCNRSFLFQSDLDKHVTQHLKQNCAGLAMMIAKLNTPEEIKRWREERRRNFPTAANIKKRQEEEAARRARGEVLDTRFSMRRKWQRRKNPKNRSHQMDGKESFIRRRRRRKRKPGNSSEFGQEQINESANYNERKFETSAKEMNTTSINNSLIEFPGTSFIEENEIDKEINDSVLMFNQSMENSEANMKENTLSNFISDSEVEEKSNFVISDSEVEDVCTVAVSSDLPITPQPPPASNKTLSKTTRLPKIDTYGTGNGDKYHKNSRVISRGASDLSFFTADKEIGDSEDELPPPVRVVESKEMDNSSLHSKVGGALGSLMSAYDTESEHDSKDEPVSEPPKEKHPVVTPSPTKDKKRPCVSRRSVTLLEKLLASEIRHERNVIFQCINFIVNKNFFDE